MAFDPHADAAGPANVTLGEMLSPPQRIACSYVPAGARPPWHALLALDRRLSRIVAEKREPLLAQMRLAWWRDILGQPAAIWPLGEPLLAALRPFEGERAALTGIVDGWERMLGEPPLPAGDFEALADARGAGFKALARVIGAADDAALLHALGRQWALADIGLHLGDADEIATIAELLGGRHAKGRISRPMRALSVLHGLAVPAFRAGRPIGGAGDFARAVRIGLAGR